MDKKVTIETLRDMKKNNIKIAMLTAYDFLMGQILDECKIEMILVGDSVANVLLGYETTIPVTMDEMIHHCKAVARGVKNALVIADMPFMSYQVSKKEALRNAGRFLKEAGASAVKIEGGKETFETVEKLVISGIPVMGHLGLTPQSVHQLGGFGLRGKEKKESEKILKDAIGLEKAGAFSVVLEKIPSDLAKEITSTLKIPTIGIGAGPYCDGQVLVSHDMLGLFERFKPKFSKRYGELATDMRICFKKYLKEVKSGKFPAEEHSY
jgi:3-methyl-2-oxobutanoate hydroxymethyltransferase